jgi:hypothetical protein
MKSLYRFHYNCQSKATPSLPLISHWQQHSSVKLFTSNHSRFCCCTTSPFFPLKAYHSRYHGPSDGRQQRFQIDCHSGLKAHNIHTASHGNGISCLSPKSRRSLRDQSQKVSESLFLHPLFLLLTLQLLVQRYQMLFENPGHYNRGTATCNTDTIGVSVGRAPT